METYNNLHGELCSVGNLTLAWRKARKRKTKRIDVVAFEKDTVEHLLDLHTELVTKTYEPRPLKTFILRDPKTRKISKSDFRDRVVHHALINVIGPIFERTFIHDSCASRINKGTLFALKRFEKFVRKVSNNCKNVSNRFSDTNWISGYCFKADIKHYFAEVDHGILMSMISRKIKDADVLWLIERIVANSEKKRESN